MKEVVLSVSHFHKQYGDFVAVEDISFDVFPGEIFGLLGPNGTIRAARSSSSLVSRSSPEASWPIYYRPTLAEANASVARIITKIPLGWLVRSVHSWSASFMIAFVLVHLVGTAFTEAYRKPR